MMIVKENDADELRSRAQKSCASGSSRSKAVTADVSITISAAHDLPVIEHVVVAEDVVITARIDHRMPAAAFADLPQGTKKGLAALLPWAPALALDFLAQRVGHHFGDALLASSREFSSRRSVSAFLILRAIERTEPEVCQFLL